MTSETIKRLENRGEYTLKTRALEEIENFGNELYRNIAIKFGGFDKRLKNAYEGRENSPKNPVNKLPNITRIWNLPFSYRGYMYGSSMGHVHSYQEPGIQEIYEFLGFGAMLISSKKEVILHICKPGSKVAIPYDCMMTILNLSYKELITLDMANPDKNESSKKILIQNKGPMLAFYNTGTSNYSETVDFKDFKDKIPVGGLVRLELNPNYPEFKSPRNKALEMRIRPTDFGLCAALIENKDKLNEMGIELVIALSHLTIPGKNHAEHCLDIGLIDLVIREDKPVHKLLGII